VLIPPPVAVRPGRRGARGRSGLGGPRKLQLPGGRIQGGTPWPGRGWALAAAGGQAQEQARSGETENGVDRSGVGTPVTFEEGRRPVRWVHGILRKWGRGAQLLDLLGHRRGGDSAQDAVLQPPGFHGRQDANASRTAAGYVVVPEQVRCTLRSGSTPDRSHVHRDTRWLDGRSVRKARPALLVGDRVDRARDEQRNAGYRPTSQPDDAAQRAPERRRPARTDVGPRGRAPLALLLCEGQLGWRAERTALMSWRPNPPSTAACHWFEIADSTGSGGSPASAAEISTSFRAHSNGNSGS